MRLRLTFPLTLVLAAVVLAISVAPAQAGFSRKTWHGRGVAARPVAEQRTGTVGYAVFDQHGRYVTGHRAKQSFHSASVLKSMLLVCYLSQGDVRGRALTTYERTQLRAMITRSADEPANWIWGRVRGCLPRLARSVGMPNFSTESVWGHSRVTPYGVARLFWRIDTRVPVRHRAFAMRQLREVVPAQRWGLATVVPAGMTISFKGGFAGYQHGGWVISQGALLGARNGHRISMAVLTNGSPTQAYGHETLRLIGRRLLAGYVPTPGMPRPK